MPAKNSKYMTGPRNLILSNDFYKKVRQETGLKLTNKQIREIIIESNNYMAEIVTDSDDALKLPENLGYIAVTRYKSNKQPTDWINSNRLHKKVPLLNLHSFNYIYHIKWFKKSDTKFGIKRVYKLEPCRLLKRRVAFNAKAGKIYHEWDSSDFWNLDKLYNKLKLKNEHLPF